MKRLLFLWSIRAGLFAGFLASAHPALAQTQSYTFNLNPAKSIPDNRASGVTELQTITNAPFTLGDVNVTLNISGDFNGDLYVSLTHSSGFAVLLNRVGRRAADDFGYDDPGLSIKLDDGAANGDVHVYRLTLGGSHDAFLTSPLTGVWAPDARNLDPATVLDTTPRTAFLSSFSGSAANGTWTLFLADISGGGSSVLNSWGLELIPVPEPRSWVLEAFGVAAVLAFRQVRGLRFLRENPAVGLSNS
jgi:subtilisin-like proprotein convertase family protein